MTPNTKTLIFALIGLTALGAAAYYVKTEILDKEEGGDGSETEEEEEERGEEVLHEEENDSPTDADSTKAREDMFSSISEANKKEPKGTTEVDTLEPPVATPGNVRNEKKKKKSIEEKKKDDEVETTEKEHLYEETCNAAKKALQDNNYVLAAKKYSEGKLCICFSIFPFLGSIT